LVWEFAELGLVEFKSSSLLADELEKHGFRVTHGIAGMPTAFVAEWRWKTSNRDDGRIQCPSRTVTKTRP
jgi:metal-dependent amidase/aminoacylase/carboxypeptidase family protein